MATPSEESRRAKISKGLKSFYDSPRGKLLMSQRVNLGNTGKKWSEERKLQARQRHAEERKLRPEESREKRRFSEEHKKKISMAQMGNKHNVGRVCSLETRKKISDSLQGERNFNWKGGISTKNELARKSLAYRLWREAVFKRDNWTCFWCKQRGSITLAPDHIKPFSLFPELRFDVENGRTLCEPCHKLTSSYGRKAVGLTRDDFMVDDFMVDCCE